MSSLSSRAAALPVRGLAKISLRGAGRKLALTPSRQRLFSPIERGLLHSRTYSSRPTPSDDPPIAGSSTPTPPPPPAASSSRVKRHIPALTTLSERTGVPLPSLAISFLVLHELTALLPLVLVFYIFSTLGAGAGLVRWITDLGQEHGGETEGGVKGWRGYVVEWYQDGQKRVERVGRRYGILGYEKVSSSTPLDASRTGSVQETPVKLESTGTIAAEKVADAIAAYVVVKALLPLRIGISIGAAPAFARYTLLPIQRLLGRMRRTRT